MCVISEPAKSSKNVISVISEATDSDHAMTSETPILNSEPKGLNSDVVSLLKRALIKFAWDEYEGTVFDIDEFIRRFNAKVPKYWKALGIDAVGYNANMLRMRGWKM